MDNTGKLKPVVIHECYWKPILRGFPAYTFKKSIKSQ